MRPDPALYSPTRFSPEVIAQLSLDPAGLCCPLMSDNDLLYTCTCALPAEVDPNEDPSTIDANQQPSMTAQQPSTADGPPAKVLAIDPASGVTEALPVSVRTNMAATVHDQTLFWAGGRVVYSMPLEKNAEPTEFPARGGLYKNGVMLSDADGFYVLTSGVEDIEEGAAPVQLLRFEPDRMLTRMDPLGDRVVFQFTQDASAFYAGMNTEQKVEQGQAFERRSSIVRIAKAGEQRSTLLAAEPLNITNPNHSGYLGVVSDGTDLFALFESAPEGGVARLQIGRVRDAATAAAASDLEPLYELDVPTRSYHTGLRLLGAVDGAVVFARNEYEERDLEADPMAVPTLRSSSVLLITSEGAVRFVADFLSDAPAVGFAAVGDRFFWLNQSGKVYGLSRDALTVP